MSKRKDLNRNKKNTKKRAVWWILGILFILILSFVGGYNIRNNRLYQALIKDESKVATIFYKQPYMLLWNKTLGFIRENKDSVVFASDNYKITIPSDKISKYYHMNLDLEKGNYQGFEEAIVYDFNLQNFSDLYAVSDISVKLPEELKQKDRIDVYGIENDELKIYKKALAVDEEGFISFPIGDYQSYALVYVPLENIEFTSNEITLKNKESISLEMRTIPENATLDKIEFEYDTEALVISSDGVLTAKKAGEFIVKIKNMTEAQEIKVVVLPALENIKVDKNNIVLKQGNTSTISVRIEPVDAVDQEIKFESLDENIATVDDNGMITAKNVGNCEIKISAVANEEIYTLVQVTVEERAEETTENGVTELTYIKGVLIANKQYALPSTYNPGVDPTALAAYYQMKEAAGLEGFSLPIISGFRSYETQKGLYQRYVNNYGQAAADRFSAMPGKSEHQTGLAFDLGWVDDSYGTTAEGKWLAENCYKYGFIIRYPEGKEEITGYMYEPWHVRYLGNPLATDVYNSGLCLEEYLGI